MRFTVVDQGAAHRTHLGPACELRHSRWDDWFKYETSYYLTYTDERGSEHGIGTVKIGQFGMGSGHSASVSEEDRPGAIRKPMLPPTFENLPRDGFFSLGQDTEYYEALNRLGEVVRTEIVEALNDIAFDPQMFERALTEKVTTTSLLRGIPRGTVEGQYRRMANGGARLTRYAFTYQPKPPPRSRQAPDPLEFDVVPESNPPTNIHVVIGRNGVGKTRLLDHMTRALTEGQDKNNEVGDFHFSNTSGGRSFTNLVSVSFSAFDSLDPVRVPGNSTIGYQYVGLKPRSKPQEEPQAPKTPAQLANDFGQSVRACLAGQRQARWRRALRQLEADPVFADIGVSSLADDDLEDDDLKEQARELFRQLSSGHKIVLLSITRLVELVEEKSLVLLDEPEAHLHPPLLSAFVRAVSDLLIDRNGVAIVATHSPVVLQEVPRSCVSILQRSGRAMRVSRPTLETFGENVGVLTQEVFGLEVTKSGFHRLLDEAAEDCGSYDDVLERFGDQLGGEARSILRGIFAARDSEADV